MNNDLKNTEHGAACGIKKRWDIEDVVAEFDPNWNPKFETLAELSRASMWSITELKELLLKG